MPKQTMTWEGEGRRVELRELCAWSKSQTVLTPVLNHWSSPHTSLYHCSLQHEIKPPHHRMKQECWVGSFSSGKGGKHFHKLQAGRGDRAARPNPAVVACECSWLWLGRFLHTQEMTKWDREMGRCIAQGYCCCWLSFGASGSPMAYPKPRDAAAEDGAVGCRDSCQMGEQALPTHALAH